MKKTLFFIGSGLLILAVLYLLFIKVKLMALSFAAGIVASAFLFGGYHGYKKIFKVSKNGF